MKAMGASAPIAARVAIHVGLASMKEDTRNYRRMASVVRRDMLARMKEQGFRRWFSCDYDQRTVERDAGEYQETTRTLTS
jgi:hypothetical protein